IYKKLVERKREFSPRTFPAYHIRRILEVALEWPVATYARLVQHALHMHAAPPDVQIITDATLFRNRRGVSDCVQRRVVDHKRCSHYVVALGEESSHIVTSKRDLSFPCRTLGCLVVSDVLHLTNPSLAVNHWKAICRSIVVHDHTQAVIVDGRYFDSECP